MTVTLWRIAADTPDWGADDLSGIGAAHKGARWNRQGERAVYTSTSISLAAWETRAHIGNAKALPWNRYLVRVDVPDSVWRSMEVLGRPLRVGWDAIPEGLVSRSAGSAWLASGRTALLAVPSVIINEEDNILINPSHSHASLISSKRVRRFVYDPRV